MGLSPKRAILGIIIIIIINIYYFEPTKSTNINVFFNKKAQYSNPSKTKEIYINNECFVSYSSVT